MAVDETGGDNRPFRVDHGRRALDIHVPFAPHRRDAPVDGDNRVAVEDRILYRARQQKPDIADDGLAGTCGGRGVMGHGVLLRWFAGQTAR